MAVPLIDFESAITSLPKNLLHKKLIVDVSPLSVHPKTILQTYLPPDTDILITNPMFGPTTTSTSSSDGQPFIYDKVRIYNERRIDRFLKVFEKSRCQMVEMSSELQDAHTADAEFVTHLTGRLLDDGKMLPATPVPSKEYAALCHVADMTSGDTFDLFYGMFKFNVNAKNFITKMRDTLAKIERQLAAKEAYLAASEELRSSDRQRLIAECKQLLQEVMSEQHRVGHTVGQVKDTTSTVIGSTTKTASTEKNIVEKSISTDDATRISTNETADAVVVSEDTTTSAKKSNKK